MVELAACGRIEVLLPPGDRAPDEFVHLLDSKGVGVSIGWVEIPSSLRLGTLGHEQERCFVIPGVAQGDYTIQGMLDSGSTMQSLRVDTGRTTRVDLARR